MWDIGSPRAKPLLAIAWVVFASVNAWLMYVLPGKETIPYHLIWASFALLYGLFAWSRATTWISFSAVTLITGIALIKHATSRIIGWEECSEIVLMGVLVALLIWHVNRQLAAQARLAEVREIERVRAHNREVTARFGSHEVRTRLTIARGFAELIRDGALDETTRNDAGLILSELDKASALTTQVLTLVRVEASSPHSQVDLVDLDELLDGVSRRWAATVNRRWSCASSAGMIYGDAERLEAALDCLVENAVKFTSEADAIELRAITQGGDVQISVRDSGTGIPQEDLARVTEVFQTGSTAGARAGSGLGLAIVRAIVSARGGRLEVASAVGVGTCVTVHIPASLSEWRRKYARPDATAAATPGPDAPLGGTLPLGSTLTRAN
jgi:signal transduction histidine kinase